MSPSRLEIHYLSDTISRKDVVVTADSLLKSQTLQKLAKLIEVDVRI